MYQNFKMCHKTVISHFWKLSDICQKYHFWHLTDSFLIKPWNISRKHSGQKSVRKLSNDTFLTHLYSRSETFPFTKTVRYQSGWFFWQFSDTLRYGMEKSENMVTIHQHQKKIKHSSNFTLVTVATSVTNPNIYIMWAKIWGCEKHTRASRCSNERISFRNNSCIVCDVEKLNLVLFAYVVAM